MFNDVKLKGLVILNCSVFFFFLYFLRGKELEMVKINGNKLKSLIIFFVVCFKRKLGFVWKGIKGGVKKEMEDYFYYFFREINDIKKNLFFFFR